MFYKMGETFRWFMGRVVDIKDPLYLGRVKIRVINEQTGEIGKKNNVGGTMPQGIHDDDLLWAWPISAIQSASLSWIKIQEMEEFETPDWIDAVGLSPTGIALSTYVFGFYLDGHEQNIPLIFGTYHKESRWPEPLTDIPTGRKSQLQLEPDPRPNYFYSDVAALAKGYFTDADFRRGGGGQTLPKEPYSVSTLWKGNEKDRAVVDEFPTAYNTEYPYNTTYTTKSGHAIELDDTPGHERVHIWHRSGCYEEISNGPSPFLDADTRSFALVADWPINGPSGYSYVTAGGVVEDDYKGRRSKKTMDSSFDVVGKDYNQLIKRDHNIEIANTETMKVGNTVHWTVGWQYSSAKQDVLPFRVNDNGKTPYESGGIDKYNLFFDIANNCIKTVSNNSVTSIGYSPKYERKLTKKDRQSWYLDVGGNSIHNSGNNLVIGVGVTKDTERNLAISDNNTQSMFIDVAKDYNVYVNEDYKSITLGNRSETIEGELKFTANNAVFVECKNGGTIIKSAGTTTLQSPTTFVSGNMNIAKSLTVGNGATGTLTGIDGKTISFNDGIITGYG